MRPIPYIAVVEDDENACRALGRLLVASGFHPVPYPSAEAFLADKKQPQFDCLVLDIHFEGMSGISLQAELIAQGSQTPVIFITADDNPFLRRKAIAAGCSAFFRKPDPGSKVIEAIHSAIEQRKNSHDSVITQPSQPTKT